MNHCFRCGQRFTPVRSNQMYCTKRCRLLDYNEKKRKPKCSDCGAIGCKYNSIYKGKRRPRACDLD